MSDKKVIHVHDLEIRHGDVYGLFASIGFDVAMAAIFSAIYSGTLPLSSSSFSSGSSSCVALVEETASWAVAAFSL